MARLVYGRKYLARPDAVEIDPVELKLSKRTYQTATLGGVFGALRDASPDYWGRLIIQRAMGAAEPDEMDYLLQSADDRAGALSFGHSEKPPAPKRVFNKTIELKELEKTARAILKENKKIDGYEAEQIERLFLFGTSMGGARPKVVVEDRSGLWLAKFNKPEDKWNFARVEHTMLSLAKKCNISTVESKVIRIAGRDILMVKRFDREKVGNEGYRRARMVSALTLLGAEENNKDSWSYPALAEELRRVCVNPKKNANELFRRMCFNALISNTDDHPRNHAILAKDKDWEISPAYDLTPSVPIAIDRRELAMTVGDYGRYANEQNLLSQCARFDLKFDEAKNMIFEMKEIIQSSWYGLARKKKVIKRDCESISGAFVYPGFSHELQRI